MKRLLFLILFVSSACFAADPPPPAAYHGKGLVLELVSEVTAVRPGKPFYAGLFIHHENGSHTYWKNPGLAGVATKLEWSLPQGWSAGAIEWPAPDKVKMAAIDTHGYERDVLLMVRITPPANTDASVTLKTEAAWMCCSRKCNPGFTSLSLTLPVEKGEAPAWNDRWHPVFERERAEIPVPLTGWQFMAVRSGKYVYLSGTPERDGLTMPENPMFFSADNLICSHPQQQWEASGTGFRARLEISDFPPKNVNTLRGVLRAKTGWLPDSPRAVSIEVPLEDDGGGK